MSLLHLDLLRHGETTLSHTLRGSTDDALTPFGWEQMQDTMMQALESGRHWDVVFSSPLQRCHLFAQKFATQQRLPLILNAHLQEMHFGDWEGLSTEKIYHDSPELLANFWQFPTRFAAPNGESLQIFQQRINSAIQHMTAQMHEKKWRRALVISHGGVIKLLKCQASQQPFDDLLKMSAPLGELHTFQYDSTALNIRMATSSSDQELSSK